MRPDPAYRDKVREFLSTCPPPIHAAIINFNSLNHSVVSSKSKCIPSHSRNPVNCRHRRSRPLVTHRLFPLPLNSAAKQPTRNQPSSRRCPPSPRTPSGSGSRLHRSDQSSHHLRMLPNQVQQPARNSRRRARPTLPGPHQHLRNPQQLRKHCLANPKPPSSSPHRARPINPRLDNANRPHGKTTITAKALASIHDRYQLSHTLRHLLAKAVDFLVLHLAHGVTPLLLKFWRKYWVNRCSRSLYAPASAAVRFAFAFFGKTAHK